MRVQAVQPLGSVQIVCSVEVWPDRIRDRHVVLVQAANQVHHRQDSPNERSACSARAPKGDRSVSAGRLERLEQLKRLEQASVVERLKRLEQAPLVEQYLASD